MKKPSINNDEICRICLELAYLLHAGIGTADALNLLAEDEERGAVKSVLECISKSVDGGSGLGAAFSEAKCFPEYVCSMISTGESSGRTEEALNSLAESLANRAALDNRLRSALLYPSVLMLIMLAVIAVLLIYVLPIFDDVYTQLGSELTGLAGGLMNFGQALGSVAPVLLAVFSIAILILALFAGVEPFRNAVLSFWQAHMGDRRLSGRLNRARFAQAMSMCFSSGMPMNTAIAQSAKLLPPTSHMQQRVGDCLSLLEKGEALASALRQSGLLPVAESRLLEAGVRGGSGERAMEQIARRMTQESDAAIEERVSRVEPTMVIISSILVGMILLSVMLPLINIMSAIG